MLNGALNSSIQQIVTLLSYVPTDRRYTLVERHLLPLATQGTALYADVSGFTALAEQLTHTLGPRLGAEALTHWLNRVYSVLIAEIDRYAGSVITFSGDAITCWFDDHPPGLAEASQGALRAVSCALQLQHAMDEFVAVPLSDGSVATLKLKVGIASGPAQRFLVGDPSLRNVDVLAGNTIIRMAAAEQCAHKGEVVVDATTLALLDARLTPGQRRTDALGNEFTVVERLAQPAPISPWPALAYDSIDQALLRPWLLPEVYEQIQVGLDEFLNELRPVVALFVRLHNIDYDADPHAYRKLDAAVARVQSVLAAYEGTLIEVIVGEKGSYVYGVFGAPLAHEDDGRRAVLAAHALLQQTSSTATTPMVSIGMSMGTMYAGVSGSAARRAYCVLGDEVNLAARLMQRAEVGELLVSGRVRDATANLFEWEALSPIQVKGKSKPIPLARFVAQRPLLPGISRYSGALIDRAPELAQLTRWVAPIFQQQSASVVYLYGEPGIGKTRLVHELRQQLATNYAAHAWYTVTADGVIRRALHPFRLLLQAYFEQHSARTQDENKARFTQRLQGLIDGTQHAGDREHAQALERATSFLGALLELHWPDSLYAQLEPKLRFDNTVEALRALVVAIAQQQPLVLHIEDAHWLDAESLDLLRILARDTSAGLALVLTSRYRDDGSLFPNPFDATVPVQLLELRALSQQGLRALAAQALDGTPSDELVAVLADKTAGNPFFAQQLVLELHERGALAQDEHATWQLESQVLVDVPATVNAVLVARLDRLAAPVKAVVQTAAVLGVEFELRVLGYMLADDPGLPRLVHQAEAATIWQALGELKYLFRHGLLRDAAYDMQLQSQLRQRHQRAGQTIEQLYQAELSAHAADLTYHYGAAADPARERRYAGMAGEYAAARFANNDAVVYLSRALALTPTEAHDERYALLLMREQVYDRQGERAAQRADLDALEPLALALNNHQRQIEVVLRRARFGDVISDYAAMVVAAEHAIALARAAANFAGQAAGHMQWARALWYQGDYTAAQLQAEQALALAKQADDQRLEADVLRVLGNVALELGDFAAARSSYEQALALHELLGDRQGQSYTLNNLGIVAFYQEDYQHARSRYLQSLRLKRENGDRYGESVALLNLGEVAVALGNYSVARASYQQALQSIILTNDRYSQSLTLLNLGEVAMVLGDYAAATDYCEQALALSRAIGHPQQEALVLARLGLLDHQRGDQQQAHAYSRQALDLAQQNNDRTTYGAALTSLGHALLAQGQTAEAATAYQQALAVREELAQAKQAAEARAGLARVALARADLPDAQQQVEAIMQHLASATLDGTDEPLRVYLTCYEVLRRAGDRRAGALLDTAYRLLQQRAARIDDAAARRSFLENIAAHRELVSAWQCAQVP